MHKKSKLKIILGFSFVILSIFLIYFQKNSYEITISQKQMLSEADKIAIEAKTTKDKEIKLYQKAEDENEYSEVKTKEEDKGLLSKTIAYEIETKDKEKPNNVTNIKSVIADDYIIISFSPAKDNASVYEYYIETSNKKDANNITKSDVTKFYSDSGIKGYNYVIDNSKETEAGIEVNKTNEEPILFSEIEWDKDYYLHIRAIDKSGNFSDNITYKIDLPSKGVTLKYIDINNKSEISPKETIIGVVNDAYNINSLKKDIEGFKLVNIDGQAEGKLKKERINVKYNYAKNANLKIRYIDEDGKNIIDDTNIDGYEGKEYNISPKEIEGYICKSSNKVGKMKAGENIVEFIYTKLGNITTKYIDEITNKSICNNTVNTYKYGEEYKTEEKEFKGYKLSKIDGKQKGIVDSENNTITYYYKKIVNMIVKHIDIDTKKVLDEEKITGLEGDKIKVESKDILGYNLNLDIDTSIKINNSEDIKIKKENIEENNKDKLLEENDEFNVNSSEKENTNIEEKINKVEKNNIIDELIEDDYVEVEDAKDDKNRIEKSIKQQYDIVLDPKETEYIIYYKKK